MTKCGSLAKGLHMVAMVEAFLVQRKWQQKQKKQGVIPTTTTSLGGIQSTYPCGREQDTQEARTPPKGKFLAGRTRGGRHPKIIFSPDTPIPLKKNYTCNVIRCLGGGGLAANISTRYPLILSSLKYSPY